MSREAERKVVTYSDFIDGQVHKTGQQVKATEVGAALFTLVVYVLSVLLAAVVIDHWIVPLKGLGRWGLLLALLGGTAGFLFLKLLPLIFRRVNPLYSAQAIEQHAPEMKNSLINHLSLRDNRQGTSKGVRRAVEEQAAQRLASAPVESAVDRGRLIRLGYVLLALMVVCAFYKFVSPKDPLTTVGRIAAPWSTVDAPTRVRIEQVTPGDTEVYADQKPVHIEAVIRGLKAGEPATVVWSTDDGRIVDQKITMQPATNDGAQFHCFLPEDQGGLRQDVRYYVTAGDDKSPVFRVEVRTPPVIAVKGIEYHYPRYMWHVRPRQAQSPGGDISAPEGTRVTIHAEANQEIKAALVDVHCDGSVDHQMQVDGKNASVTFPLQLADRQGRALQSYLVRFTNTQGHENPQPTRYSIQVQPDKSPEVKIVRPSQREVQVPLNGSLPIVVEASDDYGLRSVTMFAATETARDRSLYAAPPQLLAEEVRGPFSNARSPFLFRPQDPALRQSLKVGDVVRVRAIAHDNKQDASNAWASNVAESGELLVKITDPSEKPKDNPENSKPKDSPKENKSKENDEKKQNSDKTPDDSKKQENDKSAKKEEQKKDGKSEGSKEGGGSSQDKKQQPKEQEKSGDGGLDREQFEQLREKAEKKQKEQSEGAQPKEKNDGGQGGPPQKSPNQKSQDQKQPGGEAGAAGNSGDKKDPGSGGNSPKEGAGKKEGSEKGTTSGTPDKEQRGQGKQTGEKFPGGTGKKGKDASDGKDKPENEGATSEKKGSPDAKNNSDGSSEQPVVKPMANPDAQGKASTAKNTGLGKDEKDKPKDKNPPNPNVEGGNPKDKGGTSGGGNTSKNPMKTPQNLDEVGKTVENKPDNKPEDKSEDTTAPAPGIKKGESKKDGGNKGEHRGQGEEGGGQGADRQGAGRAGRNTASDDGGGVTSGVGTGPKSNNAGKQAESPEATGQSGSKAGPGSNSRDGNSSAGGNSKQSGQPKDGSPDGEGGSPGGNNQNAKSRSLPAGGQNNKGALTKEASDVQPSDPDLEAGKKSIDLILDLLKNHPDEAGFTEPQRVKLQRELQSLRQQADQRGRAGDLARHKIRDLAGRHSTGARTRDELGNLNEGYRGGLTRYPDSDYIDGSAKRPSRE
jgi:collagen type III alpha